MPDTPEAPDPFRMLTKLYDDQVPYLRVVAGALQGMAEGIYQDQRDNGVVEPVHHGLVWAAQEAVDAVQVLKDDLSAIIEAGRPEGWPRP